MTNNKHPLRDHVAEHSYLRVSSNDKIRDVACKMSTYHSSAAVVVDDHGKLIGIITEQDIVEKVVGARRNVDETDVDDIMARDVITVSIRAPLNVPLQLMIKNTIRTLPIMDGKDVVGILDIRDLYQALNKIMEEEMRFKDALISYSWRDTYASGLQSKS